jgi:hypothetical protein
MKKFFVILSLCLLALSVQAEPLYENQDIALDDTASFRYMFVERPKIGDVILKVSLQGASSRDIKAFAQYDMPSMRGHHASGKVEFQHNRAGDFVLPIHFAMGGDWEIVITFEENDREIYRQVLDLDI